MNKAQYKIVKFMTNFPKFDTKKFARMIGQPHSEVLKVQYTNSFEQYKESDTPLEDLMTMFNGSIFGSGK